MLVSMLTMARRKAGGSTQGARAHLLSATDVSARSPIFSTGIIYMAMLIAKSAIM